MIYIILFIKKKHWKKENLMNNFIKELEYLKSQNEEFCYEVLIDSETNEL